MRAAATVLSTELCSICGQEPLFPVMVGTGPVICGRCEGLIKRDEIARKKRAEADARARRLGLSRGVR